MCGATEEAANLQTLTVQCEQLHQREAEIQGEIEELELVSWQDKLDLEQKQQQKLTSHLDSLQVSRAITFLTKLMYLNTECHVLAIVFRNGQPSVTSKFV